MRTALIFILLLITFSLNSQSQDSENNDFDKWTLEECINHALINNIEIRQTEVTEKLASEDVELRKQAFAPSISASTNQEYRYDNLIGGNGRNNYNASYNINFNMTIFEGGRLIYTKKQAEAVKNRAIANIDNQKEIIKSKILRAYLQILLDNELVDNNKKIFELSTSEYERAKAMYEIGKISKSSLAQVATQWSNNKYNLSKSRNILRTDILELKQILELDISTNFDIEIPTITDEEVLVPLPDMIDIYHTAISVLPKIQMAKLNIKESEIGKHIAQAYWMPTITFNGGIGTNYALGEFPLNEQFKSNIAPNIGLSINIPIYDRRVAKTTVNKAKYEIESNKLNYQLIDKEISKEVEILYIEALNNQENFLTAREKLNYALESYKLVSEQFNIGTKNAIEMLTEEKNLFQAAEEVSTCKYQAIISIQLLNILQNKEIKIGE